MKNKSLIFALLFSIAIFFTYLDWNTGGFDLFKLQNYEFYFQSWVSIAGLSFTSIISLTLYIIFKKTKITSLKYISLSFLLIACSYLLITYHASYCKVCSDLALCSASHNYPNYFAVIALILVATSVILVHVKNNIEVLKVFSFGLVMASILLVSILFISIEFMEVPGDLFYKIKTINLQGFIFIAYWVFLLIVVVHFKYIGKLSKLLVSVFSLLALSSLPQAYHIFVCDECHTMECSEFYSYSALFMFLSLASLVYAITLHLKEKVYDE